MFDGEVSDDGRNDGVLPMNGAGAGACADAGAGAAATAAAASAEDDDDDSGGNKQEWHEVEEHLQIVAIH